MNKLVQILYNNHPAYRLCMNLNKEILQSHELDYTLLTERVLTTGNRIFQEDTDIERLYYLQQNPTSVYLDADCIIEKWPDFEMEPGFPYISFDEEAEMCKGWYDTWAIFGNNCQWFFDYLMSNYTKECSRWWSHKLINNMRDKIKPLPKGYIRHLYFNFALGDFKLGTKSHERNGYILKTDEYGYTLEKTVDDAKSF